MSTRIKHRLNRKKQDNMKPQIETALCHNDIIYFIDIDKIQVEVWSDGTIMIFFRVIFDDEYRLASFEMAGSTELENFEWRNRQPFEDIEIKKESKDG